MTVRVIVFVFSAKAERPGRFRDVSILCQKSRLGVASYELPEFSESLHRWDWVRRLYQQLCQVSEQDGAATLYQVTQNQNS